ncbi:MAG: cyclic-di-AMP receptor, partial [Planctomycetes bacterium]|nr:cyclic-di-AMP receptor [Planctomycetota bacterium]
TCAGRDPFDKTWIDRRLPAGGNATIITGVPETDVDRTLAIVRDVCHARAEFVPVLSLPLIDDGGYVSDPVEVRTGGATVFVLNIERFERS